MARNNFFDFPDFIEGPSSLRGGACRAHPWGKRFDQAVSRQWRETAAGTTSPCLPQWQAQPGLVRFGTS